jgi:hypothetical protein
VKYGKGDAPSGASPKILSNFFRFTLTSGVVILYNRVDDSVNRHIVNHELGRFDLLTIQK